MGSSCKAPRKPSRERARRWRLATISTDGVLSIPARAATSEATNSSSEKCGVSFISFTGCALSGLHSLRSSVQGPPRNGAQDLDFQIPHAPLQAVGADQGVLRNLQRLRFQAVHALL